MAAPTETLDELAPAFRSNSRRAHGVWRGDAAESEAQALGAVLDAADLLAALATDGSHSSRAMGSVLDELASTSPLPKDQLACAVHAHAVRDRRFLTMPADEAARAQLGLLVALAPVSGASVGRFSESGATRTVARSGACDPSKPGIGVPIGPPEHPAGALTFHCAPRHTHRALSFSTRAAAALELIFERDDLIARNVLRERALVSSAEKRLSRLGFDLHDGPTQEVLLLASDVRLLREQLHQVLRDDPRRSLLLGRVDDLEARLGTIDKDLREFASSLEPVRILQTPWDVLLRSEVEAFERRSGIRACVRLRGDLGSTDPEQAEAIRRVVHEALSNVREHSGARTVTVSIVAGPQGMQTKIRDDGHGFDVQDASARAASAGRLGLLGMAERVRVLGGRFEIHSRLGGPTALSLALPSHSSVEDSRARAA